MPSKAFSMKSGVAGRSYDGTIDDGLPEVHPRGKNKLEKQKSTVVETSQLRDRGDYHLPTIQPAQISLQPAITVNPKNWNPKADQSERDGYHDEELGDVFPVKEDRSQHMSASRLVNLHKDYVDREERLENLIQNGTIDYSVESASLNVHKIPSITFTGSSTNKTTSRRRSIKTEKTILVTEEVVQVDSSRMENIKLKMSSTMPAERDLKPILRTEKSKFTPKQPPPRVETVPAKTQHEPIFLPTPVMVSPDGARPESRNPAQHQSALDKLDSHAKRVENSSSGKKFKARPQAVDDSIAHVSQDLDFNDFMSTRLKRLELIAIDKETDVNVMKLRKELKLKDYEAEHQPDARNDLILEEDNDVLNTSIRSQAVIEPRSRVALKAIIENEAEKDAKPTYKPKPVYEIPTEIKEEKKDTGEWAFQRKAKLEKLAKEIEERDKENEKLELEREAKMKEQAEKAAAARLKQLDKLIAEESEDEDLDELEGKKDSVPDYPLYSEPLNEPTFEQPKKTVKFNYKKVKPDQ